MALMGKSQTYLSITALACVAGCASDNPGLVPVTGVVTMDQRPIAELIVTFTPVGSTPGSGALGATDSKGRFSLTNVRGGEGAYAGRYRISLYPAPVKRASELPTDVVSSGAVGVPEAYLNPNRTPLRTNVPEGGGRFEIKLNSRDDEAMVDCHPVTSAN